LQLFPYYQQFARGAHQVVAAVGGDDRDVLDADVGFALQVDARFDGEGHAGSQNGCFPDVQRGPFVAVAADGVAEAVDEVGGGRWRGRGGG
jgi:hypothetical protein